jgi:cation:H+ antiporter
VPPLSASLLSLAGGLALLLVGGQLLVNGAVALAGRLGVSTLVIGLTIVAWGTSAPELFLNLTAALSDRAELSFGNLVGANIANLGLILGLGAIIRPITVQTTIVLTELPVTLAFLVLMAVAGSVAHPLGGPASARFFGGLLVLCFAAYGAHAVRTGLEGRRADRELKAAVRDTTEEVKHLSPGLIAVLLVGGTALLKVGGDAAVDGASSLAARFHVPADIVGLTIVAFGTTLPELVTMVMAQRRGQGDLVMGNALGSCLFNAGAIFGSVLIVRPIPLPEGGAIALGVMVGLGLLTLPLTVSSGGTLVRREGAILLAIYIGFMLSRAWTVAWG